MGFLNHYIKRQDIIYILFIFIYYKKRSGLFRLKYFYRRRDHLCGLVVRVPGYISRGPGSIPGATRFSEK
jgi:hypothetical protein